jgi:tetratricopeptide (TPR) repeat protein/tRNA A-37 threonylcarbamoyl transferase component Bud32
MAAVIAAVAWKDAPMPTIYRCSQGHLWEAGPGQTACAACGAAGAPVPRDDTAPAAAPGDSCPASQVPAYVPALTKLDTPGAPPAGARTAGLPVIPGYELLGVLGRGGMGVVYKARQLSLNRIVALKMILTGAHAGPEELARFRSEAEAVAALQHPNIVQIFEVGEHDGLPYLALEYVDGGSLAQQARGLPQAPAAAAKLVETLARAVHHAHQCGVIHRDLKPGNVLLSSGLLPKMTDFGLAKRLSAAQAATPTGHILGTPGYMAPEQAAGKSAAVGPAADVHALGAILYELLTGRPPFLGGTLLETLEQVWHHEPVPPSQLQPKVQRDLETICLKCLQKQPEQRYASALALADDLGRFQRGEPIQARAVGALERGWRWCRRNPAVASLGGAVFLVLLAGLVVSSVFALEAQYRAEQETQARKDADAQALLAQANEKRAVAAKLEAEQDRAIAKAVNDFVQQDLLLQADSAEQASRGYEQQPNLTVKEALQRAAERIHDRFQGQPLVEAAIRAAIGNAYLGIGEASLAVPHLQRALALRKAMLSSDHPDTLLTMNRLGEAHFGAGRLMDALALFEEAVKRFQASVGAEDPRTLDSMANLAVAYRAAGRLADALLLFEATLKLRQQKLGPDHPDTLQSMNNLATAYQDAGRSKNALVLFAATLELRSAKLGVDHPDTLQSMNNLAAAYKEAGLLDEALPLFEQTLKLRHDKLGRYHPATLVSMNNLAVGYQAVGRHDDALSLFERAWKLQQVKLGVDHPDTLATMNNLGSTYEEVGDFIQAEALYRALLGACLRQFGLKHPRTAITLGRLGDNLLHQNKHSEAELVLRQCLEVWRKTQPDHWMTFNAELLVGAALLGQRRYAAAEALLLTGYEGMKQREVKMPTASRKRLGEAIQHLVRLYEAWRQPKSAEPWRKLLGSKV